jgi:hypothetical protein
VRSHGSHKAGCVRSYIAAAARVGEPRLIKRTIGAAGPAEGRRPGEPSRIRRRRKGRRCGKERLALVTRCGANIAPAIKPDTEGLGDTEARAPFRLRPRPKTVVFRQRPTFFAPTPVSWKQVDQIGPDAAPSDLCPDLLDEV